MRNVRSALVGLGTLIILATFVGFATFSPNGADESRPEPPTAVTEEPLVLAADAGATTGRVTAFVFANQLQTTAPAESGIATEVDEPPGELTVASFAEEDRRPPSTTTTTQSPTTTTTAAPVTSTTSPPPTTTTVPPATTTTEPPTTTTTTPPTTTTTEPPTTTTTAPSSSPLSEGEMRELASAYFPAADVDKAVLVARCESNYDPSAYNPAGPFVGLYQHSLTYWDGRAASAGWEGASPYDALANTAVSAWLVARDGWNGHWPYCGPWADGQLGG